MRNALVGPPVEVESASGLPYGGRRCLVIRMAQRLGALSDALRHVSWQRAHCLIGLGRGQFVTQQGIENEWGEPLFREVGGDRKSVVSGKSVSVRVDLGGGR